LVECDCTVEHCREIRAVANVPSANILIKRKGTEEHATEISAIANIPTADILIERRPIRKEEREVGNLGNVPLIHVGSVLQQVAEIAIDEKLIDRNVQFYPASKGSWASATICVWRCRRFS
jgi:hypothetical protein